MRKNEFDKLLKAAVIQDAEEQGKLLSSDDAPIPEEAQARFSVALDRLMPIQQTESNAQRSGSASNRASRRWVGFAVGVPVLAATVLVAGLMLFGGGIKDEKMAEAAPEPSRPTALPTEPMEHAYEPPTGAPLEVGDPEPTFEDEHDFEPSPFETGGYLRYVEEFSSDEILDPVSDTNDLVDQIESIWIGIYGEQITEQRPYQVFYDEKNGIWMVKGTLKENILGGVAYALIADGTWEVLAIWHTR